jgi:type VII secretion-associated serine protease mycosin
VRICRFGAAASVLCVAITVAFPANPAHADRHRDSQWHLSFLKVAQAQAISKGAGVTVAVVDTGVDPHPDLRNNLLAGTDVLPGATDNGQIDQDGHGTSMAGLIAAHGKNSRDGVLGIAPAAKILPVKDQRPGNTGGSTAIAAGIEWAARHGARVINVSSATGPSIALNSAVGVAARNDAVVVAGAGNRPEFLRLGFPAAMPGVLAVGAVDRSGKHASFSITGSAIQICAPGVDIETTGLKGGYYIASGTSDSTAIVSGAAALVRSKFPQLSAQEVIHRLTATATDIGPPGRDDECGYGVLNIVKALTADVPPLQSSTAPTNPAGQPPPTTTTAAAAPPDTKSASSSTPAVVGGVVIVLLVGGLVAFLIARRRKAS